MGFVNAQFEVGDKLAREAKNAESEGHQERVDQLTWARYSMDGAFRDREDKLRYGVYRSIWNSRMLDHLAGLLDWKPNESEDQYC